jgi:hypothetical protein
MARLGESQEQRCPPRVRTGRAQEAGEVQSDVSQPDKGPAALLLRCNEEKRTAPEMGRKNLRPTYLGASNDVTDHRAPPASRRGRPD